MQTPWRRRVTLPEHRLDLALRPRPRRSDTIPRFDLVKSQPCTQAQMLSTDYQLWAERVGEPALLQRRQWEWFYVLQALRQEGAIRAGARGLAIGTEADPVSTYTSSRGCDITRAAELDATTSGGYDFVWSISVLDTLATLEERTDFVRRSLDHVVPRGVAVHTFSFALAPRRPIRRVAAPACSKRDLARLEQLLRADGHQVDCTFALGDLPADRWVDRPPYSSTHLCAATGAGTVTSYGLLVHRGDR